MRKLIYVLFGLLIFSGAAGLLYMRQMQVADYAPVAAQSQEKSTTRGFSPDRPDRSASREQRGERRFDRGINQYRRQDGSWNSFSAVLDLLNVVVGVVGIGLALSGMRARRA